MSEAYVNGETAADGSWTRHAVVRETTADGEISFDPDVLAGSPFALRLRTESGAVFSDEVAWTTDDDGRRTLATDVLAHTRFTLDSRGSQGRTTFSGKIFTA